MPSRKNILIGVAWPYVNGSLHIGHLAGYLLPSDIFARYHRLIGNTVLMVSGSDCYGTPITVEADKKGVSPQEIVDTYHPKHKALFEKIGISYDLYTTTTTENHKQTVQDIFLTCLEKGYIFKDSSEQYFDPQENKFLPDRYVEGVCPFCHASPARSDQCDTCGRVLDQGELINPKSKLTNNDVVLKETEHYFFDWTKAEDFLKEYVHARKSEWKEWVHKEASSWLSQGLKPRAITRDLDWGISIPLEHIPEEQRIEGAEHKRIYVWFEAVIGYLSASKEWSKDNAKDDEWKEFWYNKDTEHVYFMGKDNLVFHTLFWPAELHAYDEKLNLPDVVSVNQFLTLEGKKFSKSNGVIVDSDYITSTYGVDPVRFFVSTIAPENADASFSWKDFILNHNGVLIGNIGNYINRVLTLSSGLTFNGDSVEKEVITKVEHYAQASKDLIEKGSTRGYVQSIIELSSFANKYISDKAPWNIKKTNPEEYTATITNALYLLLAIAVLLKPVIPQSILTLETFLGIEIDSIKENLEGQIKKYISQVKVNTKPTPLFTRIDEENIEKENQNLNL